MTATIAPPAPEALDLVDARPLVDLEVIIPAYNEENRLPATLRALERELALLAPRTSHIAVVDNASCDRTAEAVDAFLRETPGARASVIGCARRGKGAAVRRGMLTSRAHYVGFFDADLATPAETVHDAVARLEGGAQVVIASRRCEGATYEVRQPMGRRLGGWAFRRAIRDLVPDVTDTQCGFKFFSRAAARRIFADLTTAGFTFDVELLARARALGYRVDELPVAWSDDSASSLRAVSDGPRILAELVGLHRLQSGGFPTQTSA